MRSRAAARMRLIALREVDRSNSFARRSTFRGSSAAPGRARREIDGTAIQEGSAPAVKRRGHGVFGRPTPRCLPQKSSTSQQLGVNSRITAEDMRISEE